MNLFVPRNMLRPALQRAFMKATHYQNSYLFLLALASWAGDKINKNEKLSGIQEVQQMQSDQRDLKALEPPQSERVRRTIITSLQLEKQLLDPSHPSNCSWGGRKVWKCLWGRKGGPLTDPGGWLASRAYIERWHAPPLCGEALCFNYSSNSIKYLTALQNIKWKSGLCVFSQSHFLRLVQIECNMFFILFIYFIIAAPNIYNIRVTTKILFRVSGLLCFY